MEYRKIVKLHYIDFMFGVILPFIIIYIMFFPLFSKSGYIFHGDEGWYLYSNAKIAIRGIIYSWDHGPNTSNSIPFYIVEIPLLLFGSYFSNHAFTLIMATFPGIVSYFSILALLNMLYPEKDKNFKRVSAMVGSTFYLVNWQNYGLTNPMLTWAFSYTILPALTYFFIKIFKYRKLQDIIIFSLISMFGNPVPDWMYFISIEIIIFIIGLLVINLKRIKIFLKNLYILLILALFTILANSYTLIEVIIGFIDKAGGAYAKYGNPANEIITAKNESFFKFIDVLMFGQPTFNSFGINPQNWTLLNISIILFAVFILTFAIINYFLKNKLISHNYIIYFFIIILLSLFLAKGFNPPFGFIYKYVILLSPPGIVGITLDVEPWYILSALSYSFIFSLGTYEIIRKIQKMKKNPKSKGYKNKILKILAIIIIVLFISTSLYSSVYTTDVEFKSYTYPSFSPKFYPSPYINVSNYIEKNAPNSYVTWIPYNGAYSWEDNYSIKGLLSNLGGDISYNFITPTYLYPYLDKSNFTDFSTLLSMENIKYLIIDKSGQLPNDLSFNNTFNFLDQQSNLKLVYVTGFLYVYKNLDNFSVISSGVPTINDPYPNVNGTNYSNSLQSYVFYINNTNPFCLSYFSNILNYTTSSKNIGWNGIKTSNSVSFIIYKKIPTNYYYNQSLFNINSINIHGDNATLNITYNIPDILLNYSGYNNGTFSSGFSPEIQLYPSNTNPDWVSLVEGGINRKFLQTSYHQIRLSNKTGYLIFNISNFKNSSLYINYYGSSFTDISPLYYIGSFTHNGNIIYEPLSIKNTYKSFSIINDSQLIKPYILQIQQPKLLIGVYNNITYKDAIYDNSYYIDPEIFSGDNLLLNYDTLVTNNYSKIVLLLYENDNKKPVNNKQLTIHNYLNLTYQTTIDKNYTLNINVLKGNVTLKYLSYSKVLRDGINDIKLNLNETGTLTFISINASIKVNVVYGKLATIGNLTNCKKINPVQYTFYYHSSNTTLIVFKKQFSSLWIINFDGKTYHAISINNGLETGFILPPGHGKAILYYTLQTYFYIGSGLSIIFLLFSAIYFMRKNIWKK